MRVHKRIAYWVFRWFTVYPFLGIVALLFLGVLAGNIGSGLGLPALFWLSDPGHAPRIMFIGMATSVVFALLCLVGFFLESENEDVDMRDYTLSTYLPMAALLLIGTILIAIRSDEEAHPLLLLLGHAIGIVLCGTAGLALSRIAKRMAPPDTTKGRRILTEDVSGKRVWVHLFALFVTIVLAVIFVLLAWLLPRNLPAGIAICVLFAAALMTYGLVRFQLPSERVIVLVVLIGVAGCSSYFGGAKHRYPGFDYAKRVPIKTEPPMPDAALIQQETALNAWLQIVGPGTKPWLVVVTTTGGGIRAAVWTGAVLDALSNGTTFARHVRIITGASGGMVGAAYWDSSITEKGSATASVERGLPPMAQNSLDPVASTLALHDVPGLFIPWPISDRGMALERSWEEHGKEAMQRPFVDLAAGERAGWRPSLVFTPMFVEDGRRLFISNTDLFALTAHDVPDIASRPALQLLHLMPQQARTMSVATAARMSASFPWVSPAAQLPTTPERHVVDAGYWDDYGVNLATSWIEKNLRWLRDNTGGVMVVQIRDTQEELNTKRLDLPSSSDFLLRAYDEALAPVFGALMTRHPIMTFHNDHDLEQLIHCSGGLVKTTIIENPKNSVLSWALTTNQATAMLQYFNTPQADPAYARVQALRAMFKPVPPSP